MVTRLFARIVSFLRGIGAYALKHKIQAGVFLMVVAALSYWGYSSYLNSVTTTQYVLAFARTAPIQQTVTGSGQVASEHQLNLSPKASGTIASVSVKPGDTVVAGKVIATLDMTDARKSLRDAAANLEAARISYAQTQTSNTNSVQKSKDAVFAESATAYRDIQTVLTGINSIMQGNEVSGSYATKNVYAYSKLFNDSPDLVSARNRLITDYASAKSAYETAYASYNNTSRSADTASVSKLAETTYATTAQVTQVAKDLSDYVNNVHGRFNPNDTAEPSILSTHITSAQSYLSTMNTDMNAALATKNDIATAVQSSGNTNATLTEESAQLNYQKAQNSYRDAQDTLANYMVIAPFAGTIASVPLQVFDTAGSGTTVAVLITKERIATLSLNEVDAAKVRAGQNVVLTFDAIDGLTIDGTVAEVDSVGAVSQGVVSYTVKIGFNSQDVRILPGMTVNASIVTASKDDALVVPSSAIKTQGNETYVEVANYTPLEGRMPGTATTTNNRARMASTTLATDTPRGGTFTRGTGAGITVDATKTTLTRVVVTTGITSDSMTELTSGVTQGQFVVSQSLNSTGKATAQSRSIFNLFTPARQGAPATRTGTSATSGARGAGGNATFVGRPGG